MDPDTLRVRDDGTPMSLLQLDCQRALQCTAAGAGDAEDLAAVEDHGVVAMMQGLHLAHAGDGDDRRAVDAHEAACVEARLDVCLL